jgi:hypothetical protein
VPLGTRTRTPLPILVSAVIDNRKC